MSTEIAVISENDPRGSWLLQITNRKSSVADPSVSVPMKWPWVTLKGGTLRVKFLVDLR